MYSTDIQNWASFCLSCFRIFGKAESLVQRLVVSPEDETKSEQLYMCARCGSTRRM